MVHSKNPIFRRKVKCKVVVDSNLQVRVVF